MLVLSGGYVNIYIFKVVNQRFYRLSPKFCFFFFCFSSVLAEVATVFQPHTLFVFVLKTT